MNQQRMTTTVLFENAALEFLTYLVTYISSLTAAKDDNLISLHLNFEE